MLAVKQTARWLPVATLLMTMSMSGTGLAQSAREREIEARMLQMERQIQLLIAQQQELRAELAEEKARWASAPPAMQPPAVRQSTADKLPIQTVSITPAAVPGTVFKLGGYIKADFIATRTGNGQLANNASGRSLYMPGQTPVGGDPSSVDYDAHARFSRFNLGVDSVTENGDKMGAFFEMDFFGLSQDHYQTATNAYGIRLRHAYMYWNNWMAGQSWSNFVDTSAVPESVDFIGPIDGVLMVRQAQIRYTRDAFSVALENPETTYLGYGTATRIYSDRGWMPDLTLRYGWKGDWGSFSTSALVRRLYVDNGISKDSQFAGGLAVTGKWNIGESDDIRYQFSAGRGISRYIGLAIQSDATLNVDGELDTIDSLAGYVGWHHHFTPKLRSNLIYARSDYYFDDIASNPFGNDITKTVQSIRANVFYSPLPKIDLGAELMYGRREVKSGDKGDITRVQFTTKYTF